MIFATFLCPQLSGSLPFLLQVTGVGEQDPSDHPLSSMALLKTSIFQAISIVKKEYSARPVVFLEPSFRR